MPLLLTLRLISNCYQLYCGVQLHECKDYGAGHTHWFLCFVLRWLCCIFLLCYTVTNDRFRCGFDGHVIRQCKPFWVGKEAWSRLLGELGRQCQSFSRGLGWGCQTKRTCCNDHTRPPTDSEVLQCLSSCVRWSMESLIIILHPIQGKCALRPYFLYFLFFCIRFKGKCTLPHGTFETEGWLEWCPIPGWLTSDRAERWWVKCDTLLPIYL